MKKAFFVVVFVLVAMAVFGQRMDIKQKSPADGWEFIDWSVTLQGRNFLKYEWPQSWREQSGYALVNGRRLFYWLYDTIAYYDGKSSQIYDECIPRWVENLGYVIDYDNIRVSNPNSNLASSVKALMQQRGCDVSVTIITGPIGPMQGPDIDFLIVNEFLKSTGVYKTTIYPLLLFY